MNEDEYKKAFGLPTDGGDCNKKKIDKALEHALDIRKFEIGLYWQRATYFWALIAAAFAGYFALMGSAGLENKEFLAFLVSCIGLVFTFAWFQVNRGSKFWQENWENHVDMLEDSITGPLYKTVLRRPEDDEYLDEGSDSRGITYLEENVTGPKAISASKTNQLVSWFTLFIWFGLNAYAVIQTCHTTLTIIGELSFGTLTVIFLLLLDRCSGTYKDELHHVAKKRGATIVGP